MEPSETFEKLKSMLLEQVPPLKVRNESETNFEVAGTKPAMQGKQKVDGFYFAGVVQKPKDVRLYFFPVYTHPNEFIGLHAELQKCLKGKNCFHIKKMTPELEQQIKTIVKKAIDVYKKEQLI